MLSRLNFITSLTVCPSDIQKIQTLLGAVESHDPLARFLVTPLFVSPRSLQVTQDLAEAGREAYFDSGGYYIQIGRLRYQELYIPLLRSYIANQWAAIYTLPDHVPRSQDTPEQVEHKVQDTIAFSTLFFQELPDHLKPKAMPVVQGHTYAQVDACLAAYIRLGVKQIGFGSFSTVGATSEVNVATKSAVELARYVTKVAQAEGIAVHAFGLGVPALVAMLKGIGVNSFDSASWLKAAGFGQVFLPFMRAYNISYRAAQSDIQKGITFEQFEQWRELTGHRCPYCASLEALQSRKMYRAVHNLLVISESVAMINQGKHDHIRIIYENGSRKYRNEYERWLKPN